MLAKIIKKLNNFKFTALLMEIVSGVAALYALASIFLYHFAGPLDPKSKNLVREVGFSNVEGGAYLGMILFFMAIITFFISVFVCYSLIPFVKNKEKTNPRKGLLLAGVVSAVFELVLIIFMILLLAKGVADGRGYIKVLIGVTLPFGVLSMIGSGLYIIPWLKCDFYMPQIVQDKK